MPRLARSSRGAFDAPLLRRALRSRIPLPRRRRRFHPPAARRRRGDLLVRPSAHAGLHGEICVRPQGAADPAPASRALAADTTLAFCLPRCGLPRSLQSSRQPLAHPRPNRLSNPHAAAGHARVRALRHEAAGAGHLLRVVHRRKPRRRDAARRPDLLSRHAPTLPTVALAAYWTVGTMSCAFSVLAVVAINGLLTVLGAAIAGARRHRVGAERPARRADARRAVCVWIAWPTPIGSPRTRARCSGCHPRGFSEWSGWYSAARTRSLRSSD